MQDFEKLGVFYLGGEYDLATRKRQSGLVLYDSTDLTTHAVCVGMTGSGKTGLCLALLEEAAIDGIPAIAIDPKGDLGNLLLTFPQLRTEDFRPWIDESQAAREGITPDQLAEKTATLWRTGLAEWGEDGARIERFKNAADVAIYTPGASSGLPLSVLGSFAAPSDAVLADADALRERAGSAASSLLTLAGVDADPLRSREHILLAQLLEQTWREKRDLEFAGLIRGIQSPPMERVGFVDLETFFPAVERTKLAMKLNNLLASPGFAAWMQGEPLDIARLLHTPEGRPRLSIISIAHLGETERMFVVTLILGEILSWMRAQPGTSSLRAVLYMDEVFGYFPPTANPPSKTPMLTLLKQARAYGLGVVLATQNPADLDYKGLSNAGTWFLGRLQTERDKMRVLEGLEGASLQAGASFSRPEMEATLSALGSRVFLLNNVHENHPQVFQSRWCLSFLRGPLSRTQIQTLMAPRKQAAAAANDTTSTAKPTERTMAAVEGSNHRPLIPAGIREVFLRSAPSAGGKPAYRPMLWGQVRMHFVDSKADVDHWQNDVCFLSTPDERDAWSDAAPIDPQKLVLADEPGEGATFAPLPSPMSQAKNYAKWSKALAAHLYRSQTLALWKAPAIDEVSRPGETAGEFRIRIAQQAREARDAEIQKLRQQYSPKIATLENQIRRAEERVAREKSQFQNQALSTVVWLGSSILRAVMGRKGGGTVITGAGSAARSAGRAASQRDDMSRADSELERLKDKQTDLETEVQAKIDRLQSVTDQLELVEYPVKPRKSDIAVDSVALAWVS